MRRLGRPVSQVIIEGAEPEGASEHKIKARDIP